MTQRFSIASVLAAGILGLGLGLCPPAVAAPAVPTIEQLGAFSRMSGFTVAPDGKHMAALEGRGEDQVVLVWNTEALGQKPTVIGAKSMKIQAVQFVKNDVLAVSLWQPYTLKLDETTKTFIGKLMLTDLEGKTWRETMNRARPKSDIEELEQALSQPQVLDSLPNDPEHILVVDTSGVRAGDLFKVDVRTGQSERVLHSPEDVGGYITDLNGVPRARLHNYMDGGRLVIATEFRGASGGWEPHIKTYAKDREVFRVVGFAKDPNIAYVVSNRGRDKSAVFEYDIAARKLGEVAYEHKFFDVTDIDVWRRQGPNFGEITGFVYEGPRTEVDYVSPRFAALQKSIDTALQIKRAPLKLVDPATGATAQVSYPTGVYAEIDAASADLNTVVVKVSGPNDPGAYYLLKNQKELSLLAKPQPDLDPAILGTTSLVYYKARDGLDIPALLTKPSSEVYGAGPYPTVILPHGGPWGRDHLSWDWSMWPQMLASRGYAVLQPQFRGSDGWGKHLWRAGDAEWGQKMQDDKDDGAKWLIESRIAKPGHIAMFGFSYGGYSAMAAAVRPNGLYKCAIAGAGVSDIKKIWKDFYRNPYYRDAQAATVDGLNPLDHAAEIKIPIMVYHGQRDQTVPIEQSRWFVNKAKGSGQPVEYHEFDDYAHGQAWTRKIFSDQLRVIDAYLKSGCGGSGL